MILSWKRKKEMNQKSDVATKTVPVVMSDGTVENYDEHFIITDKVNCVSGGDLFHYCMDCQSLKFELQHGDGILYGMTKKDAKKEGKTECGECSRNLYLFEHDRKDEMT